MEMDKKSFPEGWEVMQLGEVCKTTSGGTPNRKNKSNFEGKIPWVKSGELDKGLILDTEEKISEEAIANSSAKIFPKGTLLIALYGATIGKLSFLGIDAATNQAVCGIFKSDAIEPQFLYYYLFFQKRSLIKQAIGGAQPNISQGILKSLPIPLPPLAEQERIVAKIEALFSELDAGKQEAEKALQQLKVYRQAVLKWAFEGRLTNEHVVDGELPEGWEWVTIEDVAKVGTGATPLKSKKDYYDGGCIAWVTSGALNDDFVQEASAYVTEKALKETNLSIYPKGTLLLAMYGEGKTRGKCSELAINATTNQAIAAIHFEQHEESIRPFLKYFLLKNYNEIRMLSSGGVQTNLNLGIVKKTRLPFPPLQEQHRIVQEIEARLSVCDEIERTLAQSLQQAEALRQSILKKAFEGKLL